MLCEKDSSELFQSTALWQFCVNTRGEILDLLSNLFRPFTMYLINKYYNQHDSRKQDALRNIHLVQSA